MKKERQFIVEQMTAKFSLQEEETCYLLAKIEDGILVSGILVSDGTLVDASADTKKGEVDLDSCSEESRVQESLE